MNIDQAIGVAAKTVEDPAGRKVMVLGDREAMDIGSRYGFELPAIYHRALEMEILPHRYLRNRDAITPAMQLRLAESRVAVIGAGGLGGNVILLLARIGVGSLVVVDGDVFDESNLNRQALCRVENIGRPKTTEAAIAVASVNPGVEVSAHHVKLGPDNGKEILAGTRVVVDGLDNVKDRFVVQKLARDLGIPLVHGAVAGFEGQVMSIMPDDPGLELLYGSDSERWQTKDRPEAVLGVPGVAPSLIATLQVMEVIKLLLDRGLPLRNRMLRVDLETGEFNAIVFREA
jgi:molybdopterin/thiamine biosynthesis adenylyltransferase